MILFCLQWALTEQACNMFSMVLVALYDTLGEKACQYIINLSEYSRTRTHFVREREMFYLTTHSTHFIYGYMASDIWLRTILIVRKEPAAAT